MTHNPIDPVCGMRVHRDTTVGTAEYRGHTYYFCCEMCRKRFVENPEEYVGPE
jgi:YHS domain-containing protein